MTNDEKAYDCRYGNHRLIPGKNLPLKHCRLINKFVLKPHKYRILPPAPYSHSTVAGGFVVIS